MVDPIVLAAAVGLVASPVAGRALYVVAIVLVVVAVFWTTYEAGAVVS